MKIAKIIPIYKATDKMSMGNYRPIYLLPATSKIFDKDVHSRLYSYNYISYCIYMYMYSIK